ncbi:hypothetical protein LTR28_011373 [Elasticomyces elasticus]|nr:hypothetical protein LTR28_011373 [Elasticomyces elasticus]
MAQRAQRRGSAPAPRLQPRADNTTAFRFLNTETEKYCVKSIPDVPFDIGEMYAGNLPVNMNDTSRQMYYVFQPTIGAPVDEVTIWFNGGPGCSSLEGFLQENGYFIWGWGQYSPTENLYSWVNLTNMLWVEFPIGLGFSYGEVTATGEEDVAQDFIGFFKNFETVFGIKNYKIYVTGESYAGRYVPYVSKAMLDQNDTTYFNLSGALMYDPVIGQFQYLGQTVPAVQYVEDHTHFFNFNATFMSELTFANEYCGYANYTNFFFSFPPRAMQPAIDYAFNNMSASGVNCNLWRAIFEAASMPNPCFNVYEISTMCPILSDPLSYPGDLYYQYPGMGGVYFNRTDVKEAMHAPQNISWTECSGPVFKGRGGQYRRGDLSADPIQSVLPAVIEATNRVLVSNGDYDFEILTKGTLMSIQNMTWGGKMGFQTKPFTPIDILLPDLQYAQVFVDSGLDGLDGPGQGIMGIQHFERGLMWGETYQSGHMQPQFQPRVSYRHLQWVLGRIDAL